MYVEIGAFDAKAKLSELLRQVQLGQSYTITVRGRPVADLVPSERSVQQNKRKAIEKMLAFKKITGVSDEIIKESITEGRL